MPVTFSQVCQCGELKTRANDGKGYFWCRHCERSCTRNNCKRCKTYTANAIRESQR